MQINDLIGFFLQDDINFYILSKIKQLNNMQLNTLKIFC